MRLPTLDDLENHEERSQYSMDIGEHEKSTSANTTNSVPPRRLRSFVKDTSSQGPGDLPDHKSHRAASPNPNIDESGRASKPAKSGHSSLRQKVARIIQSVSPKKGRPHPKRSPERYPFREHTLWVRQQHREAQLTRMIKGRDRSRPD